MLTNFHFSSDRMPPRALIRQNRLAVLTEHAARLASKNGHSSNTLTIIHGGTHPPLALHPDLEQAEVSIEQVEASLFAALVTDRDFRPGTEVHPLWTSPPELQDSRSDPLQVPGLVGGRSPTALSRLILPQSNPPDRMDGVRDVSQLPSDDDSAINQSLGSYPAPSIQSSVRGKGHDLEVTQLKLLRNIEREVLQVSSVISSPVTSERSREVSERLAKVNRALQQINRRVPVVQNFKKALLQKVRKVSAEIEEWKGELREPVVVDTGKASPSFYAVHDIDIRPKNNIIVVLSTMSQIWCRQPLSLPLFSKSSSEYRGMLEIFSCLPLLVYF